MMELIMKMAVCLLAALALGFLLGWLFSKALRSEHYLHKLQQRDKNILELEEKCQAEKLLTEKSKDDNHVLKKILDEKNKLLDSLRENKSSNENHTMSELENLYERRNQELQELETVVVKAEETIESRDEQLKEEEKRADNLFSKLESTLVEKEKIEKELKLYTVGKEDDEFIISKDQFVHIEEQLAQYQKEIETLKKENESLHSRKIETSKMLEDLIEKGSKAEGDDASIVKIFKETYKKIKN